MQELPVQTRWSLHDHDTGSMCRLPGPGLQQSAVPGPCYQQDLSGSPLLLKTVHSSSDLYQNLIQSGCSNYIGMAGTAKTNPSRSHVGYGVAYSAAVAVLREQGAAASLVHGAEQLLVHPSCVVVDLEPHPCLLSDGSGALCYGIWGGAVCYYLATGRAELLWFSWRPREFLPVCGKVYWYPCGVTWDSSSLIAWGDAVMLAG